MIKVKIWVYMENCGDGSCVARFFNLEKDAEAYAGNDNERFCEDIVFEELQIDELTGKLLNPPLAKDR